MKNLLVPWTILLFLTAALAGQTGSGVPCPDDRLSGVWELRMAMTSSAVPDSTVGVSLSCLQEPLSGVWVSMALASHAGVYSGQLERVGIRTELMQPIVGARMGPADSVRIVLHPGPDHGAVVLLGAIRDSSIHGRWYQTGFASGASGTFRLLQVATPTDWARLAGYFYEHQGN